MKQMHLALSLRHLGYHVAAWRHPEVPADGSVSFSHYLNAVRLAEAARFDAIFFADSLGIRDQDIPPGVMERTNQNIEFDPQILLAALATHTTHIGLIATASTTYNEPFHIARRYASIDQLSGGRVGWNVVTSWSDAEALNFGRDEQMTKADRYARAGEFVDVVRGLWDSWEPGAFLRDKASGRFYDPEKRHVLNHRGQHFQVMGPLNAPPSPQGAPVLFSAGASGDGRDLSARIADGIYCNANTIEEGRSYYADMKARARRFGRDETQMLIMPGVSVFVAPTRDAARAEQERMLELVDPLVGLRILYRNFGDLTALPLDGPLPLLTGAPTSEAERIHAMAMQEELTIRALAQRLASSSGVRTLVGTPADVADDLQHWFDSGAADGFNICPPAVPVSVRAFADLVVPELQRRNLFRREYGGATLRSHLGLSPHANRHATALR